MEIGCGIGQKTGEIIKYTDKITAVDISKESIDIVKNSFKNVNFFVMDASNLSFNDKSFDVVITTDSFHEMNQDIQLDALKEIEDDPRTVKDLFVDRYGATPLSELFMINEDEIESKLTEGIVLVELYNDDSIQCLLKSIPVKEITKDFPSDTLFYKAESKEENLPALLIYKNKELLGKIEGYYTTSQKEEFISMIKEIINK